jgi:ankyrin repeat protein
MKACENGHTTVVDLLIAKGADVEAKDKVILRRIRCM